MWTTTATAHETATSLAREDLSAADAALSLCAGASLMEAPRNMGDMYHHAPPPAGFDLSGGADDEDDELDVDVDPDGAILGDLEDAYGDDEADEPYDDEDEAVLSGARKEDDLDFEDEDEDDEDELDDDEYWDDEDIEQELEEYEDEDDEEDLFEFFADEEEDENY